MPVERRSNIGTSSSMEDSWREQSHSGNTSPRAQPLKPPQPLPRQCLGVSNSNLRRRIEMHQLPIEMSDFHYQRYESKEDDPKAGSQYARYTLVAIGTAFHSSAHVPVSEVLSNHSRPFGEKRRGPSL